ncbi:hypothetical protein EGW08_003567, partial [Elysia chlorotica]
SCTRFCRARDDYLGHFTCTATGQQVCKDGWQGLECSQAICSSRCMATRATCPAPNTCVCLPGWRGQHCDLCTPRPGCQHGTCSLPGQCACSHGWTGPLCDIEKEFCDLYQPCQNGGSCTHLGQHNYACACSTGYNGTHCEIPVCYVGFCHNEGTCSPHGKTKALCVCPEPFLGTHCLQRRSPGSTSPCSSSPCLYGGECFNIVQTTGASSSDEFSCKCLDGFSGDRCELDISIDTSLCAPSPCRNGGTCVEYDGEFLCVCADGFRGSLC